VVDAKEPNLFRLTAATHVVAEKPVDLAALDAHRRAVDHRHVDAALGALPSGPRWGPAPERGRDQSTSAQSGEAAKAAWMSPTCEYAWGKLPHMRRSAVS
jgi:hypothetical protein